MNNIILYLFLYAYVQITDVISTFLFDITVPFIVVIIGILKQNLKALQRIFVNVYNLTFITEYYIN